MGRRGSIAAAAGLTAAAAGTAAAWSIVAPAGLTVAAAGLMLFTVAAGSIVAAAVAGSIIVSNRANNASDRVQHPGLDGRSLSRAKADRPRQGIVGVGRVSG